MGVVELSVWLSFLVEMCLDIGRNVFSNCVGMSAQILKSIKLAVILSQSKQL